MMPVISINPYTPYIPLWVRRGLDARAAKKMYDTYWKAIHYKSWKYLEDMMQEGIEYIPYLNDYFDELQRRAKTMTTDQKLVWFKLCKKIFESDETRMQDFFDKQIYPNINRD